MLVFIVYGFYTKDLHSKRLTVFVIALWVSVESAHLFGKQLLSCCRREAHIHFQVQLCSGDRATITVRIQIRLSATNRTYLQFVILIDRYNFGGLNSRQSLIFKSKYLHAHPHNIYTHVCIGEHACSKNKILKISQTKHVIYVQTTMIYSYFLFSSYIELLETKPPHVNTMPLCCAAGVAFPCLCAHFFFCTLTPLLREYVFAFSIWGTKSRQQKCLTKRKSFITYHRTSSESMMCLLTLCVLHRKIAIQTPNTQRCTDKTTKFRK